MAGSRKLRLPRLHGLVLWVPVTALLALGILTTLRDLSHLPLSESIYANTHRQRFVINAATGTVSLGDTGSDSSETADIPAFDVSAAEPATPPAAPDEPVTAMETAAPPAAAPDDETPAPPATALPAGAPTLRTTPLATTLPATARSKESLVSAPAPEITETVAGLSIPKRGDRDVTPAVLYARPFTRRAEQILLSFVVIDAGLDPQTIPLMMALPPAVTVAYSPYARAETRHSETLRIAGHEVWTMLPLMGDRYPSDDPGPMGIIGHMPPEEILRRLHQVMAAVPGSVGLVLPPDETVSLKKETFAPVLGEVSARGMRLFSTHPTRSIAQITPNAGLAETLRRADLILDPAPDESQIRSKLAGIQAAAKEKGEYIVVLSARPQSLQLLGEWLKAAPLTEPFTLAPLSALYLPKEAPVVKAAESGGHGGGGEAKKEEKPQEKKKKPLLQDQYKQPAEGEKKPAHGSGH
ncbi:MAG: divergent polysaccharide deacetylase family protein [Alphaproteobacteria bacterium]|nr:divergent polysaccharide deacetylase family protein [Alphaproteobacteria bacterium]